MTLRSIAQAIPVQGTYCVLYIPQPLLSWFQNVLSLDSLVNTG